ncbi:hypothetical protein [Oceanicola sp. S124]|uniref:hypothetical protein n=1 Tax=Oceanicola sp. S124 TaxID=1042378 RepID=UPI0002558990|nr:hypothetical protein [Oceanicola sp. S124]
MCDFIITPLVTALGAGGAATAAGSTAAAATSFASTMQTIGSVLAIAGPVVQGMQVASAAKANVKLVENQKRHQAALDATKADRERRRFQSQLAQQRAELASRGVQLDSATAVLLGQSAAAEMSFNDQAIRSGAQATQAELSAEQVNYRAKASQALLRGGLSAAGAWLDRPADEWAELMS